MTVESQVLTQNAIEFLHALHRAFEPRRRDILEARARRQAEIDRTGSLDFLPETRLIREGDWVAAPIPKELQDRRVEITGPVDRKMIINALNSGARVFMADFEDSNSPTWANQLEGQVNLRDAIRREIHYQNESGKQYRLNAKIAVLMVRPRGWHLVEKHFQVDGAPMSGSLFDFGLFFFHNAKELLARGTAPYFYLPKMESHREARLWNEVFCWAQDRLEIPRGTIKATCLIETITAVFEAHEIIYELKDHIAGLNCGRWDYIFSYIKKFRNHSSFVLPDRSTITMSTPFLDAYSRYIIQTCHRRRVHAMGGMSAFIPIKGDESKNRAVLEKIAQDKLREVKNGHDGTWVAHPGLVEPATKIFDEHMPQANQYGITRSEDRFRAQDFLQAPSAQVTEAGLRLNINVGVQYLESWLRGVGAAAIHHLMEDAATAEISRTQLWQWIHHGSQLDDGQKISADLFRRLFESELENVKNEVGDALFSSQTMKAAISIFERLVLDKNLSEFLTSIAYERLS